MTPSVIKHCGFIAPTADSHTGSDGSNAPCLSPDEASTVDVRLLNSIALKGLMRMFNPQLGLFCHHVKREASGVSTEGISPLYTMMTLLGLSRIESAGIPSPVPISKTFETLFKDTRWVKNIGDIGLLLWLSAMACPEYLEQIVTQLNVRGVLDHVRNRTTIDLAIFLAGIAHHSTAAGGRLSNLTDQAVNTFRQLKQNQGEQGIFGHCARSKSFSGMVRGRIGSFADQSYSIYALARAAQCFSLEDAATTALDCALTMCQLQGPLGQWWWHYDAVSGRVVGRYPIFSVHQGGTAPMALMELGRTLNSDFSPWVAKGLRWIGGENELHEDLRDTSANMIWGYIQRDEFKKLLHAAVAIFTRREDAMSSENLTVSYECRPYHHGMILYAFGASGLA